MSDTAPFRQASAAERAVLEKLLAREFPGAEELRAQVKSVLVRDAGAYRPKSLQLAVDRARKPAAVRERIPTEGEVSDSDGVKIHILLYVVDGYATELEVYREDGAPPKCELTADGMTLGIT